MKQQYKQTTMAAAVALALAAPNAWAQQNTDAPVARVVVTGTNLKRVDSETASPVQILTRKEIEQSGAQTVAEILGNVASNDHGAISDLGGTNSWASGASGVSLRNLGATATLVLLNGRRLSSYGFADGLQANFVNIDAIPSDVIERVEILKDGASAIYGSDAIAGVINIITRRDFRGVGVKVAAQQSTRNSYLDAEQKFSVTGGLGDLDKDGYNVWAHVEGFHRVGYKDRDARPFLPDWYLRMNPERNALSTGSVPGNYVGRYPANYSNPALAGKSINTAAPGCAAADLSGGLCFYDYWKDSDARAPAERLTFMSGGRMKLGATTTGYAELQLAGTRDDYHTAPPRSNVNGVALSWYDSMKGEMQYFTDPKLPVGHASNPYSFPIGLNYRFADHPEMFKNVGSASQFRVLAGLEGQDMGWDWDGAVGFMGSTAKQRQHLYRDRYAYADAITSGEYKFGQQNSRELLDRMFPNMGSHGQYRQAFVDFKASRELMQLPGGPLQMAAGFDLRHESFEHKSSDNVLAAQIVQFSGVSIAGSRNLAAAFVELGAPFTQKLEGSFALRGDKAIHRAGAVVPKFGLKYKVSNAFMLRGTATEGFRAPSIPETGNGGASWFNNGYTDPKRCAAATELRNILNTGNAADKNNALTAYALGCSVSFPAAVTPNPDLKPEKTKSFTLGFVLQPMREISITFDYYNIKRRDEIAVKSVDETLANEDRIAGLVQRDPLSSQDSELAQRASELAGRNVGFPIGPIKTIAAQYENLGKTAVSGIDVEVSSRWMLGEWGKINAGLEMNRQLSYRGWDAYQNTYTENYVGFRGTPRMIAIAKANWELGKVNVGLRVNHSSATQLGWSSLDTSNSIEGCADRDVDAAACRIAADTTADLWTKIQLMQNTSLSANLFNVFDRKDPVQMRVGSGLPLRGRTILLTLEHKF
ncbi:TonB-dependent receptor domain-containing protein [Massilia sp. CF038]|uniref:TonB-dependent receptor domain-containing protein n=1 Tax=Massilia sp. CF038 TaxID=1881045 RepID=UPI0009162334|nr:TonB-dependent receptor [Massilia sp. CF038]SHG75864.1 iron complex outermembrane recepter protein [Massilia sp. CF038]